MEENAGLAISKQEADALFDLVGEEVEEKEDQINFKRYSELFSDCVHKHLMELLEELRLPYEMAWDMGVEDQDFFHIGGNNGCGGPRFLSHWR